MAACLAAASASAHHSYVAFDAAKQLTLEGTVKSYDWSNPHVSFKMTVAAPGAPAREWNIETHGPAILEKYGWSASTLKAGSAVRVLCNPMRDGSPGCRLLTVLLVNTGQTLETKLSRSLKARGAD